MNHGSVLDSGMKNCAPPCWEHGRSARSPEAPFTTLQRPGVLIVDDDLSVRTVLGAGLQRYGFAVWLAADGQEALRLYRRQHEDVAVVLLDVRMPGLDGPQTLAAFLQLNPGVLCCFMSGDTGSYTEEELLELGAVCVFAKPFRLEDVVPILRQLAGIISVD